jgi:Protein of unknown function (DUF3644)
VRPPAYNTLVAKSRAACVAALETYNRALAPYREENFAILMINAWELLLKARIIKENGGKLSSVYVREVARLKSGQYGKRTRIRLTRCGSPYTISIVEARNIVRGYKKDGLDEIAAANITALIDIRDHATHFIASQTSLTKTLSEISFAAVRNYIIASQKWFKVTFSDLNLAAIPISFSLSQTHSEAVAKATPAEVVRFLAHIKREEEGLTTVASDYWYSVVVAINVVKKAMDDAVPIKLAGPGETPHFTVSIEDDKLPPGMTWTYSDLTKACRKRYSDFLQNDVFHKIRGRLEKDKKLCHERFLVPGNKNGQRTKFYNPNILREFDRHYSLKPSNVSPPLGSGK